MIYTLRYGEDASLPLDLADEALLAHCDAPRGKPVGCVGHAVDQALAEPIGYPPLAQVVVPGDKIALAVADGVPCAPAVIGRCVEALLAAGVAAGDIAVVHTAVDAAESGDPLGTLSDDVRSAIPLKIHDPEDRDSLGYLAASTAGEPVYINRAIHDADLVITIGCLRLDGSLGYHGINSSLFPTFSDAARIKRFRSPTSSESKEHAQLRRATDEAGWLLGAQFTIQLVPGKGEDVLHVIAGEIEAVFREGQQRCVDAWDFEVPERASLVIATIQGGAAQQTWDNVARALAAAAHAVQQDGAVAICCELSAKIGPGLQHIVGADDIDRAMRTISRRLPVDALAAAELVRALKRGKVYLLSKLEPNLVEDLGMVPIEAEQVARLVTRYESFVLLSNAQYAIARARCELAGKSSVLQSNGPK